MFSFTLIIISNHELLTNFKNAIAILFLILLFKKKNEEKNTLLVFAFTLIIKSIHESLTPFNNANAILFLFFMFKKDKKEE